MSLLNILKKVFFLFLDFDFVLNGECEVGIFVSHLLFMGFFEACDVVICLLLGLLHLLDVLLFEVTELVVVSLYLTLLFFTLLADFHQMKVAIDLTEASLACREPQTKTL